MLATEPASVSNRLDASDRFGESRPGTLSTPVTGMSPAPPTTVGISPPADHPVVDANRNSTPALNACLFFVQPTVSVKVDNGLVFPRSPLTPPLMLMT